MAVVVKCRFCGDWCKPSGDHGLCSFCASIAESSEKSPDGVAFWLRCRTARLGPWQRLVFLPAACAPVIAAVCAVASLWSPLVAQDFARLKDAALSGVVFGASSGLVLGVVFWLRWYLFFYRPGSRQQGGGAVEIVQQKNGG